MKIRNLAAAVVWTTGVAAWAQTPTSQAAPVQTAAAAQFTGVSHPEQIPVTTSPEGISQPVVYEGGAAQDATVQEPVAPMPSTPALRTPAAAQTAPPAAYEETALAQPVPHRPDTVERDDAAAARAQEMDRDFLSTPAVRTDLKPTDERIVTRVAGPSNQLPTGTLLKVRLRDGLSTGKTQVGQPFRAELVFPVLRDGRVLLPAGSMVTGQVADVHGGRRITGSASITLRPTAVTLPDGTRYGIRAQLIDSDLYRTTHVDGEGTLVSKDHTARTVAVFGLSTGASAATGAVLGGWPGALIGAGVGAGVATVMWLKKDRQTEMPPDTKMVFSLNAPLVVGGE